MTAIVRKRETRALFIAATLNTLMAAAGFYVYSLTHIRAAAGRGVHGDLHRGQSVCVVCGARPRQDQRALPAGALFPGAAVQHFAGAGGAGGGADLAAPIADPRGVYRAVRRGVLPGQQEGTNPSGRKKAVPEGHRIEHVRVRKIGIRYNIRIQLDGESDDPLIHSRLLKSAQEIRHNLARRV